VLRVDNAAQVKQQQQQQQQQIKTTTKNWKHY
jgi:hypothetical protein